MRSQKSRTPLSKNEDEDLIRQIQNGDKDSFARLFHSYYPDLCNFVLRYTRSPAVSEDLIQDIFLDIWHSRKTLSSEGSIKSYLYKSARNKALNHLKHKRIVNKWEKESQLFEFEVAKSPAAEIHNRESFSEIECAIKKAIEQLPDRRKMIFLLSREEGLTYQEIADVLDISVNTVETQISRSITIIRQFLSESLSEDQEL